MATLSNISRRDFLNGAALTIGAAPFTVGACARQNTADIASSETRAAYPPAMTGMRGSHVGSFEVAHQLAWENKSWPRPEAQTDDDYDLIIVGGGISGLAAAYFFQERHGADSRILILDNHDDFGGHAKRNEFSVDGKTLVAYGGSQLIEGPSGYSDNTKKLLSAIGLETDRFYQFYNQDFFSEQGLQERIYFDAEHYGVDKLVKSIIPNIGSTDSAEIIGTAIDQFPMSAASRDSLKALFLKPQDYLAGETIEDKKKLMRSISYEKFLQDHAGLTEEAALFLRRRYLGIWAVGWDSLSAMEGMRLGMPGTYVLGFLETYSDGEEEPSVFRFPDGNAGIARMLVRSLLPGSAPGDTMEDSAMARFDYGKLDEEGAPLRLRLSATAVDVRNTSDTSVDVVYVKNGASHRVRGKYAVMACYAKMTPFLCSQMPRAQREAIEYSEKTPLVYVNVALRNWRAFKQAGVSRLYSPRAFYHSIRLNYPITMGDYAYASSPDEPTIALMQYAPITPGQGLSMKEQSRLGRQKLYQMPFDEFERNVVSQLTGAFGAYGFNADEDIAGITVNRWPHGYAYEYNELEDDPSFGWSNGPHIAGRAPIGRIAMANSDSEASSYVDAAIDAADRAINELLLG
ncbi:MAG: NAD(P)-binding protein [Pseudomonadota bacterium]